MRTFYVQHGNNHLDANGTDNVYEFAEIISQTDETVITSTVVFPNPFTDFLVVAHQIEFSPLYLYNQTGQLVATGFNQLRDLGYLPTGIYFLQIKSGNSMVVEKVVKVE